MATTPPDAVPRQGLLIVDDNESIRKLLSRALGKELDLEIEAVGSARDARERLARRSFAVVITDISMPGEDGISLMQSARERFPGPIWIVLTGHGTLDAAVSALQLGAFDFISKPLNIATLRKSVRNALDQHRLREERDRLNVELAKSNEQLREHVSQLEGACLLLGEQAEMIRADLRRAALIQRALLPQTAPNTPGFRIHALYRPSAIVGGDLYDVVRLDARHLALLVADAAGHGLSAAMLAVLFRHRLPLTDGNSGEPCAPCEALEAVNRSLTRATAAPGLFITAVHGLLDMEARTLKIASAGHLPLIIQRRSGSVERVFHTGPALGLYPDAVFAQQEVVFEVGDRIILHTDGLFDRLRAASGTPSEKVIRALEGNGGDAESMLRRLADFGDRTPEESAGELSDDVTIVMLSAGAGSSSLDNGPALPVPMASQRGVDRKVEMWVGSDAHRTTLSLRGEAHWAQSAVFHQVCVEALDARRAVTLDLTLCDHLDSTFLGTIHELVQRADEADVEMRLQGVMPPVEALFREVGMRNVLEHSVPVMLPMPSEMCAVECGSLDISVQARRVLQAHESLAGLSDRNRMEFDPLLEALRREVAVEKSSDAG